eukprot:Nitzschia sp. Nitz4//scaffold7_size249615//228137//228451//NITZ4_001214-RA/size249615-exonerate_est2genome-gene-0.116-mRNA-1//1//CDS//3329558553//2617//frame0
MWQQHWRGTWTRTAKASLAKAMDLTCSVLVSVLLVSLELVSAVAVVVVEWVRWRHKNTIPCTRRLDKAKLDDGSANFRANADATTARLGNSDSCNMGSSKQRVR